MMAKKEIVRCLLGGGAVRGKGEGKSCPQIRINED
jgi:hypothetical protein